MGRKDHQVQTTKTHATVVTPETVGWRTLSFEHHRLDEGLQIEVDCGEHEAAIVPLSADLHVRTAAGEWRLTRDGVFEEMPSVLYLPPGEPATLEAARNSEFAIGRAPAEGRYPERVFTPDTMRTELRGGRGATRHVHHILAHPLPAERLIAYEVYVPGGNWSGWPPHCHDGYAGSPYLEETYYFRFDQNSGSGFHRNYRVDRDFDEVYSVVDGDIICVTEGFHYSAATPGSNMYFLNFLAGDLHNDERATPPYFHPDHRWIEGRWDEVTLQPPAASEGAMDIAWKTVNRA